MAYQSRYQKKNTKVPNIFTISTPESTAGYNTLEYPIGELGGERYPHYTIFYINEDTKSESILTEGVIDNVDTNARTSNTSQSRTLASSLQAGSKKLGDAISGTITRLPGADSQLVKDNLVPVVEKIAGALKTFSASKKRIAKAICLPMPAKVIANYTAGYNQTDATGALGATIMSALGRHGLPDAETLAVAIAPTVAGVVVKTGTNLLSNVPGVGKPLAEVIDTNFNANTISQLVSKLSGRVINKRQEQLFSNMEFRAHQFTYLFIPRTETESNKITEIIMTFKRHMHPELSEGTGASLLITPAEFDIEFRYGMEENTVLSRVATCALKGFDVNYTAIGEFVAFEGTKNPVAISIDMTFIEMEPLTRAMIEKGY